MAQSADSPVAHIPAPRGLEHASEALGSFRGIRFRPEPRNARQKRGAERRMLNEKMAAEAAVNVVEGLPYRARLTAPDVPPPQTRWNGGGRVWVKCACSGSGWLELQDMAVAICPGCQQIFGRVGRTIIAGEVPKQEG